MFKRFISLQWKAFLRSASFGKSVGVKVIMIIFSLIMLAYLAILGGFLYLILRKIFPTQGPMWMLSHFMVYWVLGELFFRYFMQKLPVMDIKPMLINNISKSKITHYILGKSAFSGFNLLSLVTFLPFCVVLTVKGYPALNVWIWFLAMVLVALCLNYLNFLINKSDKVLAVIIGLLVSFYALEYFQVLEVKAFFAPIFHALYAYPLTIFIVLGLLVLLYAANYVNTKKSCI